MGKVHRFPETLKGMLLFGRWVSVYTVNSDISSSPWYTLIKSKMLLDKTLQHLIWYPIKYVWLLFKHPRQLTIFSINNMLELLMTGILHLPRCKTLHLYSGINLPTSADAGFFSTINGMTIWFPQTSCQTCPKHFSRRWMMVFLLAFHETWQAVRDGSSLSNRGVVSIALGNHCWMTWICLWWYETPPTCRTPTENPASQGSSRPSSFYCSVLRASRIVGLQDFFSRRWGRNMRVVGDMLWSNVLFT